MPTTAALWGSQDHSDHYTTRITVAPLRSLRSPENPTVSPGNDPARGTNLAGKCGRVFLGCGKHTFVLLWVVWPVAVVGVPVAGVS